MRELDVVPPGHGDVAPGRRPRSRSGRRHRSRPGQRRTRARSAGPVSKARPSPPGPPCFVKRAAKARAVAGTSSAPWASWNPCQRPRRPATIRIADEGEALVAVDSTRSAMSCPAGSRALLGRSAPVHAAPARSSTTAPGPPAPHDVVVDRATHDRPGLDPRPSAPARARRPAAGRGCPGSAGSTLPRRWPPRRRAGPPSSTGPRGRGTRCPSLEALPGERTTGRARACSRARRSPLHPLARLGRHGPDAPLNAGTVAIETPARSATA